MGTDQDVGDRKAKIDEHKHDQLNKQKEGKGHWKGELGSNSESAVCFCLFLYISFLWKRGVGGGDWMGYCGKKGSGADDVRFGGMIRSRRIERRLWTRSMILRVCRRRRARRWRGTMNMGRSEEGRILVG